MLCIDEARTGQPAIVMDAESALALARERFPNLAANGILGKGCAGPPIDLDHVSKALAFLSWCRKSRKPAVHSFDLRRAVGGVSVGAMICAAHAAGFDVRGWMGTRTFVPHAMIGVDPDDVARCGGSITIE
jgi:hypothetical protein